MNKRDKIELIVGLTIFVAGAATAILAHRKVNRLESDWQKKIRDNDEDAIAVEENMKKPL